MATSLVYAWNPNVAKIINGSLRLLGAIQTGETPPDDEYEDALDALNGLMKFWQAGGIHLWSENDATLFLQANQIRYLIGGTDATDPDRCAVSAAWQQTALTVDGAASDSTLTVAAAGNANTGDRIGIWLDSGVTFWTTVAAPPAGSVIALTTVLPSAATTGAIVVHYAANEALVRPLKVPAARRYLFAPVGGIPIETPMSVMSRIDYGMMTNKTTPGVPTQYFFDPQLDFAVMNVWPAPSSNLNAIKFTCQLPLTDLLNQANTADLPQEWISTLRYNLAVELAPEYDCPAQRFQIIKALADEKMEMCRSWDREPESVGFGVSYDMPWRN